MYMIFNATLHKDMLSTALNDSTSLGPPRFRALRGVFIGVIADDQMPKLPPDTILSYPSYPLPWSRHVSWLLQEEQNQGVASDTLPWHLL